MRVINESAIVRFTGKHPDSREWLESWLIVARDASWRTIQDVKRVYPAADGGVKVASGARVTVFDVGGNKYRMVTDIAYTIQTVTVLELMTHAEYSKDRWKERF
jgi:mRNA interferase HigB